MPKIKSTFLKLRNIDILTKYNDLFSFYFLLMIYKVNIRGFKCAQPCKSKYFILIRFIEWKRFSNYIFWFRISFNSKWYY